MHRPGAADLVTIWPFTRGEFVRVNDRFWQSKMNIEKPVCAHHPGKAGKPGGTLISRV